MAGAEGRLSRESSAGAGAGCRGGPRALGARRGEGGISHRPVAVDSRAETTWDLRAAETCMNIHTYAAPGRTLLAGALRQRHPKFHASAAPAAEL